MEQREVRAPAPPTQAQAPSVIGLRLPQKRPRPSASSGCASVGGFWRCGVRTGSVPFKLSWKGKPRHRPTFRWERRSAWFAPRDQTGIQTPRGRRHGNAETPRADREPSSVAPRKRDCVPPILARPRSLLARASPDRHPPGPAPRISHHPSPGPDPLDLRPPGTCPHPHPCFPRGHCWPGIKNMNRRGCRKCRWKCGSRETKSPHFGVCSFRPPELVHCPFLNWALML